MVGKASRILGILKRTIVSSDLVLWKERKNLEGDIDRIESVKRIATRIPFRFGNSSMKNDLKVHNVKG